MFKLNSWFIEISKKYNGIIFDTRFATDKVSKRISDLLKQEMKISNIDFYYMIAYVSLTVYILNNIKESKRCKSFVREFVTLHRMIDKLPAECKIQIKGTDYENILKSLGILLDTDFLS